RDSLTQFIEQKFRWLLLCRLVVKIIFAGVRTNAVAAEFLNSRAVGEFIGRDAKVPFASKAGWRWLWHLDKSQGFRMGAEELLHRRRGGRIARGITGSNSMQEFQELSSVLRREAVSGVTDDVRVNAVRQVKADREASWIGFRMRVRDIGKSRGIRESCNHGN